MDDWAIIVPPSHVDSVRRAIEDLNIADHTRRLKHLKSENKVAVPFITRTKCSELTTSTDQLISVVAKRVQYDDIEVRKLHLAAAKKANIIPPEQRLRNELRKLLESHGHPWTDAIDHDVPSHWERHGDLVLIPDSTLNLPVWHGIGDEAWQTVCTCLSCRRLARKSVVSTDGYRRPQVSLLYGNDGWVQQVDNHIKYTYDVTKCMFSSGNITEKLRVASFDCQDKVVVDLYAGIGYFTLPYLMYTGVMHLHACEWNQDAVEALQRNLLLNKVQDRCTVYYGDNRKVCPIGIADRVNLGLIPSSRDGWSVACRALKPDVGGVLHIHYNVNTKPGYVDTKQGNVNNKQGNIDSKQGNVKIKQGNIDSKQGSVKDEQGNNCTKEGNIDTSINTNQTYDENLSGNIDRNLKYTGTNSGQFDCNLGHINSRKNGQKDDIDIKQIHVTYEQENNGETFTLATLDLENQSSIDAQTRGTDDSMGQNQTQETSDSTGQCATLQTSNNNVKQNKAQRASNSVRQYEIQNTDNSAGHFEQPVSRSQNMFNERANSNCAKSGMIGDNENKNESEDRDACIKGPEEFDSENNVTDEFESFRREGKITSSCTTNADELLKRYIEYQFYHHTNCLNFLQNKTDGNKKCDFCMDESGDGNVANMLNDEHTLKEDKLYDYKVHLSEKLQKIKHSKWFSWAVETSQEIKAILEHLHNVFWVAEIIHIEHVKSYAPHVDHIVLDLRCFPLSKILQ